MAKKNKKKTPEDHLIDFIGEEVNSETAIIASAINLVYAGKIAKKDRNSDHLIRIAEAWYSLARMLGSLEDSVDEKTKVFGFGALETIHDPGSEPDEGESGTEVRSKSW